jgi:hypothetical protein
MNSLPAKFFAERLRCADRLYGTLIVSPSPHWVPVVASLGLDFVFIDTEHIPLDREKLAWMCQAYHAVGLPPIVRITSPDPYEACVALDGGAVGIVAPYVETPEQVRELVGAVKKRPLKGRTLARHLAPSGLKILVLERGDWLPQEPQNWDAAEVFQKGRYISKDVWHDKHGKPFQPGSHYFVGGATKMYGAAHFRLRQKDFEQVEAGYQ